MARSWRYPFLMFLWLSIGYGAVHATILGFSLSSWIQSINVDDEVQESLFIADDGELLIAGHTPTGMTYRRRDGTEVTDVRDRYPRFVSPISLLRGFSTVDFTSWMDRIRSFTDFQTPATSWYLVSPPSADKTAYFVGYERSFRRIMGYLGTNGFSKDPPMPQDRFASNSDPFSFVGNLAATQKPFLGVQIPFEPQANSTYENLAQDQFAEIFVQNAKPDTVWILSKGNVYEIELGKRSVRILLENRPDVLSIQRTSLHQDGRVLLRLILRTNTGVLILDPKSEESKFVELPTPTSNTWEYVYQLSSGECVIDQISPWVSGMRTQRHLLTWTGSEDQQQLEIETGSAFHETGTLENLGISLMFPAPLASVAAWIAVRFVMKENPTVVAQQLSNLFQIWILVSFFIGLATCWACRRRETSAFDNKSLFWPILVGLFGWFGWMAYSCLRPLPPRMADGRRLPTRPEPAPLLGTEILVASKA